MIGKAFHDRIGEEIWRGQWVSRRADRGFARRATSPAAGTGTPPMAAAARMFLNLANENPPRESRFARSYMEHTGVRYRHYGLPKDLES